MAHGVPLSDAQRDAWIERVMAEIRDGPPRVVACSALRSDDRDRMRAARAVRFVLLDVPEAVLSRRLADRPAHFFPAALLDSQLARFEPPAPDEDVLVVDGDRPLPEIVDDIAAGLTR
jgi:carbohydrate kinase (thermoresistant glucokinase family)